MKKSIKLYKDCELTLSNNAGWLMEYRDQFGHDIVPDILPIVSAITKVLTEISTNTGKSLTEAFMAIPKDAMEDALIELASLQSVDIINVVWAMAKTADDDIEVPKKWIRQFESFPMDVILPAVWNLVLEGFVSSKNLKSLSGAGATKKSASTRSSSQASKED